MRRTWAIRVSRMVCMRATRGARMSRQERLETALRALVGAWSPPGLVVALAVLVRVGQWGDVAAEVAAAEAAGEEAAEGVVEGVEVEVALDGGYPERHTDYRF